VKLSLASHYNFWNDALMEVLVFGFIDLVGRAWIEKMNLFSPICRLYLVSYSGE